MLFLFTREVIKKILKNYRPISLLPFRGSFLEKLKFSGMCKFFMENDLISSNQSGDKPGGPSVNQLLFIAHEIFKSLSCGYDVRCIVLDNSKAFDKIKQNGVVFKLEHIDISGNLLKILQDY